MFNIFKRKPKNDSNGDQKLGMLQKLAMKRLEKMSPEEREKMAREAFRPENRGKLLQAMEMMKKTGQITDEQMEEAKKKMGL